jgi:hypothetical protein
MLHIALKKKRKWNEDIAVESRNEGIMSSSLRDTAGSRKTSRTRSRTGAASTSRIREPGEQLQDLPGISIYACILAMFS